MCTYRSHLINLLTCTKKLVILKQFGNLNLCESIYDRFEGTRNKVTLQTDYERQFYHIMIELV